MSCKGASLASLALMRLPRAKDIIAHVKILLALYSEGRAAARLEQMVRPFR